MPGTTEAAFLIVQIAYWIALATWFGGVLFIVVANPIVFRTVRDADPTLPKVISVNLDGQHSTLLAGTIMGDLLRTVIHVMLVCDAVLVPTLIIQFFVINMSNPVTPILRTALFIAASALLIYLWRVGIPRAETYRTKYVESADEPDVANPALDQFDRYSKEIEQVMLFLLAALLMMILFSTDIRMVAAVVSQN